MITISNIQVRSIKPGSVKRHKEGFGYSIIVNDNIEVESKEVFTAATTAKQMMRENVYRLRRIHGPVLPT